MTIRIDKPHDIQALFERATRDANEHGIKWAGDTRSGNASGRGFEGTYVVDNGFITIHLIKKPKLITKSRVERAVKSYISLPS